MSLFNKPPPPRKARGTCDECGHVSVDFEDLTLRICIDNWYSEYRFTCPLCKKIVVEVASQRLADLMRQLGIRTEEYYLPLEAYESKEHPPITSDDLLECWAEMSDL